MNRSLSFSRRRSRKGVVIVLVAMAMVALVTFVAICVDGGGLLDRRRHAQAAADAAALAAAESLFKNYPTDRGLDPNGTASQAALQIAALNGFQNDGTESNVTIRTAPQTYLGGPNAGKDLPLGAAEVIVQYNQRRYFSAVIGTGTIPVQARAVARGKWEAADVAIHVLDLHEPASLTSTGESFVTVSGAKIIVNSDASSAATTTGGTITAPTMDITGGTSVSGSKGGFNADINYGVPPAPDPLRNIPEPSQQNYPLKSNGPIHIANGTRILQPGRYQGGISVSGQGSLRMEPGIYIMEGGGFSFSGQGDLNAEGVMIFNSPKRSSDVVSITGTGSVIMSPPVSTLYKGLTLFQARFSENTMTVSGGGYMNITGTFYTANGKLAVGGGGASRVGSQYISRFLEIVGGGGLLIDYTKEEAIPRRVYGLIE